MYLSSQVCSMMQTHLSYMTSVLVWCKWFILHYNRSQKYKPIYSSIHTSLTDKIQVLSYITWANNAPFHNFFRKLTWKNPFCQADSHSDAHVLLQCSQEHTTRQNPELDECIPHPLCLRYSLILSSHIHLVPPNVFKHSLKKTQSELERSLHSLILL